MRPAPLQQECAVAGELLDAVIVEIGHIDGTVGGDRHPARRIELTGASSVRPDRALRRSVKRKDLNAVVEIFRDEELIALHVEVHGTPELATRGSGLAEAAQELAVRIEDLNATIAGVGDENLIASTRNPRWIVELAGGLALGAPGRDDMIAGLFGRRDEGKPCRGNENGKAGEAPTGDPDKVLAHGSEILAEAGPQDVVALKSDAIQILHQG